MHFLWNDILTIVSYVLESSWRWVRWFTSSTHVQSGDLNLKQIPPYPVTQIKGNVKHRTTMGLRRLDERNWLTVDNNYISEHLIRGDLFHNQRGKVFSCLPEAKEACEDALQAVAEFLPQRYPLMFEMTRQSSGPTIHNKKTGDKFVVGGLNIEMEPLEIAARLAMEDLSVILKNDQDQHYL